MRTTTERRQEIIDILCKRRYETIDNLAFEFSVDRRTIRRDIEVLSISFPLYTKKGIGGGVHIVEGFRLGMKYLTDKQYEILYQISERLDGEEKTVVLGILKTFAYSREQAKDIVDNWKNNAQQIYPKVLELLHNNK